MAAATKGLEDIQFFGAVDRKGKKKDGKITSEYPAFYFTNAINDLEEEVSRRKRMIEDGLVPPDKLAHEKQTLERDSLRLLDIKNTIPKLSGKQKDELAKMYEYLAEQISDSMYTRSESKKGLANSHEEARRMKEGIINVKEYAKIFENNGIPVGRSGKVGRDFAAKMMKIAGKVLGEETNIERFRKDYKHGTYQFERSLDEMDRDMPLK